MPVFLCLILCLIVQKSAVNKGQAARRFGVDLLYFQISQLHHTMKDSQHEKYYRRIECRHTIGRYPGHACGRKANYQSGACDTHQ
jgi:hypothetical protein